MTNKDKIKELKNKIRKSAMIGGAAITGLLSGQYVNAQEKASQDKEEFKTEYKAQIQEKQKMDKENKTAFFEDYVNSQKEFLNERNESWQEFTNGPKEFIAARQEAVREFTGDSQQKPSQNQPAAEKTTETESAYYFSAAVLAKALLESDFNEDQCAEFAQKYVKSADEQGRITPSGLAHVFNEMGIEENKALEVCDNMLKYDREERLGVVHHAEENGEFVDYSFHNGKLMISKYSILSHALHLVPQVKNVGSGYQCGTSFHENSKVARRKEETEIRTLYVKNMIYNDLNKRTKQGEELGENEKAFKEKYLKDVEAHGLKINDKGRLENPNSQINTIIQNAQKTL